MDPSTVLETMYEENEKKEKFPGRYRIYRSKSLEKKKNEEEDIWRSKSLEKKKNEETFRRRCRNISQSLTVIEGMYEEKFPRFSYVRKSSRRSIFETLHTLDSVWVILMRSYNIGHFQASHWKDFIMESRGIRGIFADDAEDLIKFVCKKFDVSSGSLPPYAADPSVRWFFAFELLVWLSSVLYSLTFHDMTYELDVHNMIYELDVRLRYLEAMEIDCDDFNIPSDIVRSMISGLMQPFQKTIELKTRKKESSQVEKSRLETSTLQEKKSRLETSTLQEEKSKQSALAALQEWLSGDSFQCRRFIKIVNDLKAAEVKYDDLVKSTVDFLDPKKCNAAQALERFFQPDELFFFQEACSREQLGILKVLFNDIQCFDIVSRIQLLRPAIYLGESETVLPKSPFPSSDPPKVFVEFRQGPYKNTRNALARLDLTPARGKKVLLKPNAGRVSDEASGVVTHPQVVAATIDAFSEVGASEVAVGESPISGVHALEALEKCGISDIARARNCSLIDFDRREATKVVLHKDRYIAVNVLQVCSDLLDYDIVVSIPVMKTHMHTGVTLGIKNMKGCLWRRSKVLFHMIPSIQGVNDLTLDVAIADLASVLRPHLCVIDGTVGMEGLGPSAGVPKPVDTVVAGFDSLAADSVACEIMGISASTIPHLRLAEARGVGTLNIQFIDVFPAEWRSCVSPFTISSVSDLDQFSNCRILDEKSCSACQSTLFLFLKQHSDLLKEYTDSEVALENQPAVLAIGKGHQTVPTGTICIGNCTRRHSDRGVYIAGCPPVCSRIVSAIGDHLEQKRKLLYDQIESNVVVDHIVASKNLEW